MPRLSPRPWHPQITLHCRTEWGYPALAGALRRILFPALLLISTAAYAHSGGLDGQGGHNDRAAGTYHFHQGPLAGETFATKEQGTAALQGEVAPAPTNFQNLQFKHGSESC